MLLPLCGANMKAVLPQIKLGDSVLEPPVQTSPAGSMDTPSERVKHNWSSRNDFVVVLCLALLAGALRLVGLERVPPGLHFDEAYDALDGLKVLNGEHHLFFEGNFGREPLFMYLLAGAFALFAASPAVIRAVPALAGTLAVPLTYGIGRQLFPARPWLAVTAALIQAVLPWDLHFSRYGIRVELLPLLGSAAIFCLLVAWRHGRWRWFAASGICLGLSLYTYMAARLLPFVFLLWAPLALRQRRGKERRRLLLGLVLAAFWAALVFAPLATYFWQHPASFSYRAGQVALKGDATQYLKQALANAWLWAKAFPLSGDSNPRNNLPGAPAVTPWLLLPLALGCLWSARRLFRPEGGLLCLWFAIMLLPSVLSDYAPSFQRAIGAVPPLTLLLALGLWLMAQGLTTLSRRPWLGALAAALLLTGQAVQGLHQYFIVWGRSNALYYAFDEGIYQIGQYIREHH